MTDNEVTREKTFNEELPYLKERMKDAFERYTNSDGHIDVVDISLLIDTKRILRKAEEEINRQQEEIERLKGWENLLKAEKHLLIKTEAIKEFEKRLKNKIKTECNPYGKPTFDYDTSIAIMRYIDNLVKEMVGE